MTNHWVDIKNADVVLVMGGNSAEAHPVGFKWVTEAKAVNGAKLICVDPRFNRTASVADYYAPIRVGTDIVFLGAAMSWLMENDRIQHEYVRNYTDMPFIVREDFDFADGVFSGYEAESRRYDKTTWDYEIGEDGYARVDPTMQHPRCVYQLMRRHYSRYTPEMVERICGTPREQFLEIMEIISSTATPDRAMTICYALGWTQHSKGSQTIRAGAMLQLLLGNIGVAGGGMNALRGHSNIQGLSDLGLMSNLLPGYLTLPSDHEQAYEDYLETRTLQPLRPGQMSYWQNYPKFHVSLMKSWYGDAATEENNWAYDYLPKLDRLYDMLQVYELMDRGEMTGYICQGFNTLAAAPNKAKMNSALAKLKYLVVIDPLPTDTSEFWKNFGAANDVDPSQIQTEVFRLPTTVFAEGEGALVNSGRWLQWHWKGADAPKGVRTDIEIMTRLYMRLKRMYEEEGGAYPDPILNLHWPYVKEVPTAAELAMEYNGKALVDLADPSDPSRITRRAGEQIAGFGELRDDGTTACGCWIFAGCWGPDGNLMGRRDNADPTGIGQTQGWAWAWPANRRILYNRASADLEGKPFNRERPLVWWDGNHWTGVDVPDFAVNSAPEEGMSPFIMNPEGVARFFARAGLNEGPFPEHYEPFETPLGYNPLHPDNPVATTNPAARVFESDLATMGTVDEFPYVGTSYRLTEHFHFWTRHVPLNAIIQPEQFVEIGEALAEEKGIARGDRVRLTSKRGFIEAVAVVTKRIRPLQVDGRTVHQIGVPLHWGMTGIAKPGFLTNTLTVSVGDGNSQTPEFKAFLVNLEKV